MQYVCESTKGRTWFRIETDAEAEAETALMRHAVEKHVRREQDRARKSYVPGQGLERDIQLKAHIQRTTPLFLTLRADDGAGLATVSLRPHLVWGPGDRNVVPRALALAARGRLRIVGAGANRVDLTHIENVVDAHLHPEESLEKIPI